MFKYHSRVVKYMPETNIDKRIEEQKRQTRRGFLKYSIPIAVGAAAVTASYYYFGYIPETPYISPNATIPTTIIPTTPSPTITPLINPVEAYAKELGIESSVIQKISPLGTDGVMDESEQLLVDCLSDITKFDFTRYQKSVITSDEKSTMQKKLTDAILGKDNEISDTKRKTLSYLHKNSALPMLPKMIKHSFSGRTIELIARVADIKANPELVVELARLPDASKDGDRYIQFFDHIVDISGEKDLQAGFEGVLNEGLKYGRKYASLLECLYWSWKDGRNVEDLLRPFNRERIVNDGWKNYTSEKWADFQKVKDRLSSGFLSAKYAQANFTYENVREMEPANYIFKRKKGNCVGFASFDFSCLFENGYNIYTFYLYYKDGRDHAIDEYKENGKKVISSNGKRMEYEKFEDGIEMIAKGHGSSIRTWVDGTSEIKNINGYNRDEI